MYSIQHYVIKFVSDLQQWFFPGTPVSSTNKADRHDITEILLKVALNTITLTPSCEIKESSLSDTRCCITTVVIKEWCDVAEDFM
jgi:hypothetical protein